MSNTCTVCGHSYDLGVHVNCLWPLLQIGSTCVLFVATTMYSLQCTWFVATATLLRIGSTCVLFMATTMYSLQCTLLVATTTLLLQIHYYILCLWPLLQIHYYALSPQLVDTNCSLYYPMATTMNFTLFIIVMFMFYNYILKLYLPAAGVPG